jgi:hypothetical protein
MIRFLVLLLLGATLRAAVASPALTGFTGVLTSPSALSQAFQSGAVGVSLLPEHTRLFLNYGLLETGEITLSGTPLDVRLHAKYTWRLQGSHSPAVAVGVAELFGGGDATSLYLVAGGQLPAGGRLPGIRLAAGVATSGALRPFFANTEIPVAPVMSLIAEWNGHVNAGVRVDPTAEIRILLGIVRDHAAFGVSYDIGL